LPLLGPEMRSLLAPRAAGNKDVAWHEDQGYVPVGFAEGRYLFRGEAGGFLSNALTGTMGFNSEVDELRNRLMLQVAREFPPGYDYSVTFSDELIEKLLMITKEAYRITSSPYYEILKERDLCLQLRSALYNDEDLSSLPRDTRWDITGSIRDVVINMIYNTSPGEIEFGNDWQDVGSGDAFRRYVGPSIGYAIYVLPSEEFNAFAEEGKAQVVKKLKPVANYYPTVKGEIDLRAYSKIIVDEWTFRCIKRIVRGEQLPAIYQGLRELLTELLESGKIGYVDIDLNAGTEAFRQWDNFCKLARKQLSDYPAADRDFIYRSVGEWCPRVVQTSP